jgi:hypothetical protein
MDGKESGMNASIPRPFKKVFSAALVALSVLVLPHTASARIVHVKARDAAAIQRAIDRLSATGGTVIISGVAGAPIAVRQSIVIARNNVTLEGEDGAVLRLADGVNSPVIIVGEAAAAPLTPHYNVRVCNLTIDGNRANQTSEIDPDNPALRNNGISLRHVSSVSVEGVTVRSCRSGGLVAELGCSGITVSNFESYDNHFDGLAAYETEASTFTRMRLHDNLAAGLSFDINFERNIVSDCILTANGSVGIFMRDSRDNVFSGMQIINGGQHGIFLAQADTDVNTAASGNTFQGCVISGSGGAGVRINDASCVDNILASSQLVGNAGGGVSEAVTGLLTLSAVITR